MAEPPEYLEPTKSRPSLDLALADPPITRVLTVDTSAAQTLLPFNVPVRSEDAGDALLAIFYLSFGQPEQTPLWPFDKEPASTFDDTERVISMNWNYRLMEPGCQQLSLVVTHESNFDVESFSPTDSDDVAIATWWVNVDDDPSSPNPMGECPSQRSGGGQ